MIPQPQSSLERDIAAALEQIDVTSLDLWNDLDVLSTHTHVEGIDVPVEGIIVEENDRFSAIMNVYLLLQYGKDEDEGFLESESFLAHLKGHLREGRPIVDQSSVDTSDYYQ